VSPDFEWDRGKAAANRVTHGVDFDEATAALFDPLRRTYEDPKHSVDEERSLLVGHDRRGRLLVVSFAERDGRIRIINARRATRTERRHHEERRGG
jgi:uncharacterized DUF497 family protein